MEFVHPFYDLDALCRLYQEAFSDAPSYLRFLAQNGWLSPSAMYAVTENGQLQSALAAPRYLLRCGSFEGVCAYFCYVASFKNCQGKGYASALIRFALEDLKQQQVPFVCLIPSSAELFAYYARFGFSDMFTYSSTTFMPRDEPDGCFRKIGAADAEVYYDGYAARYQKIPFCCYKPRSMFSAYAAEHLLSGGEIFSDGQNILFAIRQGSRYRVVEYGGTPSFQTFCNEVGIPVCVEDVGADSTLGMGLVLDGKQIRPTDLSGNFGYCNAMFN